MRQSLGNQLVRQHSIENAPDAPEWSGGAPTGTPDWQQHGYRGAKLSLSIRSDDIPRKSLLCRDGQHVRKIRAAESSASMALREHRVN